MIGSLTKIDKKAQSKGKELIVLSMPKNSNYDGRIDYVKEKSDVYKTGKFFTNNYELLFNRTNIQKTVTVNNKEYQAIVFEFKKLRQK